MLIDICIHIITNPAYDNPTLFYLGFSTADPREVVGDRKGRAVLHNMLQLWI